MYVKLFSKILDSSIADNRQLRHFFTDLLLCADGKGYVVMTEGALARRIGAALDEVRWGLAELQKPDQQSHSPGSEGRRIERLEGVGYGWRIINYEHYRAMKDADQLREATKERVRRHREKKAGNATVTAGNIGNAITEAEAEGENIHTPRPEGMPNTAAEAIARCQNLGIPEKFVVGLWEQMEARGWVDGAGQGVKNWTYYAKQRWEKQKDKEGRESARSSGVSPSSKRRNDSCL